MHTHNYIKMYTYVEKLRDDERVYSLRRVRRLLLHYFLTRLYTCLFGYCVHIHTRARARTANMKKRLGSGVQHYVMFE